MKRRSLCILILLILALTMVPTARADSQAGAPVWFPETRHSLGYAFRVFWDRSGGLPIFGYPLTEVFVEDGRPVQYFERARLEWHADLGIVLAGHLGRWLAQGKTDPAFAPRAAAAYPGQLYFPEAQHTLGGLFRQYWERNGALPVFGYPLSEEFLEVNPQDGQTYTVQYFERARFEYHPELPAAYRVSLGHLGRQYMAALNPAPDWARSGVDSANSAWNAVRPTRVRMPRIGISTSVIETGFSLGAWDVPDSAAAHYWPVAGYPGMKGNIVIAGHVGYRDRMFNHLPQAVVGDALYLTVDGAERAYTVSEIVTLLPDQTWVMAPTATEVVTLITCVPIGVYSHRLVVRARPVQE